MSKGKIRKPENPNLPDNLTKKPLEDIIYHVVQTCEVEVENSEWQDSDKALDEKISQLSSKTGEIEKRLGDNQGNLSEQITNIKTEIENLKKRKPLDLIITINNTKKTDLGKQHFQFPTLVKILATKLNVYLVGPAGSGKTHAAIQVAKALKVPFHFTGAVASEFKLTGFMDAQGRIVSTEFRKAYENGGLFLFDEIDASYPQAVLAFNAALANDYMDFPDKRIPRHKDFYCIAAANTYGQGADRQYIGRNQLDAASLDRFVFIDWNYDENLERDLAGNEEWSNFVQKIRRVIVANKIRHVVSPRASIFGAILLANEVERNVVENTVLWKGLDEATKNKIIDYFIPKQIKATQEGMFIPKVKANTKIKENEIIGEIQYEKSDRFGGYTTTKTLEILSPYNGSVLKIISQKKIQESNVIAEIEAYDNK
jgi:cobaltochelatase CobS